MWYWLVACASSGVDAPPPACDPRTLGPGEVRVKQAACGDELVDGGEGRPGDWVLENAVARFVVRGTYAPLTEREGDGGTLIDAVRLDVGEDLLVEYLPDADRSALEPGTDGDAVTLEAPGVTWRLAPDTDVLEVIGAAAGRLVGHPEATRGGATLVDGAAFLALDGEVVDDAATPRLDGVTRVALSPASRWPDGGPLGGLVDADAVDVEVDGGVVARFPVAEGAVAPWLPAGGTARGVREGCVYEGLAPVRCASLRLRLQDQDGRPLRGTVSDGTSRWFVPEGGGTVPVGPVARPLAVWAGPAHGRATVPFAGEDAEAYLTLHREVDEAGWVLADLDVPAPPDADATLPVVEALRARTGEGVGFAAAVADDEVPSPSVDPYDPLHAVAASRASGLLWSWPWSPNGRRAAHGAVPAGLGALDLLAVSEGGQSAARRTVVTVGWVALAREEAPPSAWTERPDTIWLAGPADVPTYLDLLRDWVDVAPVGPFTWVGVEGAPTATAVEAGLVAGRTVAGNGPRLRVEVGRALGEGHRVTVTVEAPHWMDVDRAWLHTPDGTEALPLTGGRGVAWVPAGTAFVVAEARGDAAPPWLVDEAWAVGGATWLQGPG